jgi:hypothetical protein
MSHLEGDWNRIANILNPARMRAKLEQAGKRVGLAGVAAVKKGIVNGAPGGEALQPLHPFTTAAKGSTKPLIDHGDLVGSITHETPDINTVWIGVKKASAGRNGDMANIAAVHEFGRTIKVTPKMRAYLHHKGLHLFPQTEYIHIPERSFLRATLNDPEFRQKIGEVYLRALSEAFFP